MADTIDALKELRTGLVNTRHGYEAALASGPEAEIMRVLKRMRAIHAGAAGAVAEILSARSRCGR